MNQRADTGAARPEEGGTPWTLPLGRWFGIPVRLHFTFFLLLGFLAWVEARQGRSAVLEVVFLIGLFTSVLMHEFGHALTARRYAIRTRDIVLYPIGGVARLESMGKPSQEFWIAIAGPLVNVVIVVVLLAGMIAFGLNPIPASALTVVNGQGVLDLAAVLDDENVLRRLVVSNVLLALFNLIPAFPMDGGRILRALLAMRLDYTLATSIAARIGQAAAIGFFIVGLFQFNVVLMFIGLFIFLGAGAENSATRQAAATAGYKVRDAMITRFETLTHGRTLGDAADALLNTYQQDFPVVFGDKVLGVLTRDQLLMGLAKDGRAAYVGESMTREIRQFSPDDDLQPAIEFVASSRSPALVFEEDKLIGLVTVENIGEFIVVRQMLARRHEPVRP